MSKEKWYSIIRHTLTAVGGILIAVGFGNETIIMEVIGTSLAILGTLWGVQNKKSENDI